MSDIDYCSRLIWPTTVPAKLLRRLGRATCDRGSASWLRGSIVFDCCETGNQPAMKDV